jgi:hypothetical protein
MKISLEALNITLAYLKVLNDTDINQLEIYENNKLINIPQSVKDEWKYVGLSNVEFLKLRIWENEEE